MQIFIMYRFHRAEETRCKKDMKTRRHFVYGMASLLVLLAASKLSQVIKYGADITTELSIEKEQ